MLRVMFAGDSLGQTTGLSYVAASFLCQFAKAGDCQLAHCTIAGDDSSPGRLSAHGEEFAQLLKNVTLYNAQVVDHQRAPRFDEAVLDFRPDVVVSVHDPWMLDMISFSRLRDSYSWIAYSTVEIPRYPVMVFNLLPVLNTPKKSVRETLSKADLVVPVTKMAKAALGEGGYGLPNVTDRVYNGLDIENRCRERMPKSKVFGSSVPDDAFVFCTMGLNTERKRLDKVVEAFSIFLKGRNDAKKYRLYIHTDKDTMTGGTDISTMVRDLGLGEQVLFPFMYRIGMGIKREDLYARYRASDCYIGLPSGEGFGYGFAEAMLHGLPLIYTDYGGHTEFAHEAGLPVKVASFVHAKAAYMKWAIADVEDAARIMNRMVSDPHLRRAKGEAGERYALANFGWDNVYQQLRTHVDECAKRRTAFIPGLVMRRVI